MIVNVNAQIVRSAMQCQAGKSDNRFYIYGVLFAANGDIVATNGKVLFKCPHAFEPPAEWRDTILRFEKPPAVAAKTLAIELDDVTGSATPDNGPVLRIGIIDGEYPDYNRVIKDENYTDAVTSICVDARYLSAISKVFPECCVLFHHGKTEDGPIKITPAFIVMDAPPNASERLAAFKDSIMLIMPVGAPKAK